MLHRSFIARVALLGLLGAVGGGASPGWASCPDPVVRPANATGANEDDPPTEEPIDPPAEDPDDPPADGPDDPPAEDPDDPPTDEPEDPPTENPEEPGDVPDGEFADPTPMDRDSITGLGLDHNGSRRYMLRSDQRGHKFVGVARRIMRGACLSLKSGLSRWTCAGSDGFLWQTADVSMPFVRGRQPSVLI